MYHGFQPSNSFWPAELVQIAQIRIYMDQQEAVLSAPFHQQYTHKKKNLWAVFKTICSPFILVGCSGFS